jgi:hypothetical protein
MGIVGDYTIAAAATRDRQHQKGEAAARRLASPATIPV